MTSMPTKTVRRTVAVLLLPALVWMVLGLAAGCEQKPAEPVEPTPPSEKPATPEATKPATAEGTEPATPEATKPTTAAPAPAEAAVDEEGWERLFDGKTLDKWKSTPFGGEGKVVVEDGQIVLPMGAGDLTGITWAGDPNDLPKIDYEIHVKAMRLDGNDFFCGLTFPYKDAHASLICGGWGGALIGISSFDFMDAANNETSTFYQFESNQWYDIRLRIRENSMEAWIDGKQVIKAAPGERKVNVRIEVEESCPLGIAAWHTKAAIREIKLRRLLDE